MGVGCCVFSGCLSVVCCLGFWFSDDAAAAAGGVGAWSGSVCVWVVVGWVSPKCRLSSPRRVREGGCWVGRQAGRWVYVGLADNCMYTTDTHSVQARRCRQGARRTREISDRVVRALTTRRIRDGRRVFGARARVLLSHGWRDPTRDSFGRGSRWFVAFTSSSNKKMLARSAAHFLAVEDGLIS